MKANKITTITFNELNLSEKELEFLNRKGKSVGDGIKDVIDILQRHEKHAMEELKGIFTVSEWMFLFDSLNGTLTDNDFRFSSDALIEHNIDAQRYDGTADKWGIDLRQLNRKCRRLTSSQTDALYRRVDEYWKDPDSWTHPNRIMTDF